MQGRPVVILFAEDNDAHAKLVLRTLGEHRVANRVERVVDGESLLDYLLRRRAYADEALSPRPDIILLDLRLPKIDGLEALRIIKSTPELQKIPVVVLTTSAAETDIARAYELHANSYVVKPLDFSSFTQMLRDLGLFWLVWNESPNA